MALAAGVGGSALAGGSAERPLGAAPAPAPERHTVSAVVASGPASGTAAGRGVALVAAATSTAAAATTTSPAADRAAVSGLAASGIPSTALAAYRAAATRETRRLPACGLVWPLLAGIGRVESNHGRFAGAVLHSDGVSTPRIIGIPLDGHGTALIRDTDGGRLDGDTTFDRAVGPMQFIPSTWATWGVDANHDGVKDPFNIIDAAAAAADYLCAAGRNLRTYAGEVSAVRSYNDSDAYIALVLQLERVYASGAVGVTVPVIPTRPGSADDAPTLPPVDPGRPRGAPSSATSAAPTTATPAHPSGSTRATGSRPTSAAPSSSGSGGATCAPSSPTPTATSSASGRTSTSRPPGASSAASRLTTPASPTASSTASSTASLTATAPSGVASTTPNGCPNR